MDMPTEEKEPATIAPYQGEKLEVENIVLNAVLVSIVTV